MICSYCLKLNYVLDLGGGGHIMLWENRLEQITVDCIRSAVLYEDDPWGPPTWPIDGP